MRRAFVVVIDACGAGELPDAADYGDAGSNTLRHLAEAVGGLRLPTLQRLGLGSIMEIPGVAPAEHPAVHGRVGAQGPGKESVTGHWELMGAIPGDPAADVPGGVPRRRRRRAGAGDRPHVPVQHALQRHRGHRGVRGGAPADRRAHPLHVTGLRPADRRAHERAGRGRARRGVPHRPRCDGRRARGRARDRAAVRGRAGHVAAHGGPQGPLATAADAVLPRRPHRPGHPGPRRRQDPRPVRRRRDHREPSGGDEPARARVDDRAHRRPGPGPRVHEPRRDRPGLRAPQGRRGLPPRAAGDRRDRRRGGSRS